MLLLHPYQETSQMRISLDIDNTDNAKDPPGRELLELLYDVNEWLGITGIAPGICASQDGKTLYILYRNVAFVLSEFWNCFAWTMAQINQIWPLYAFGTAENQDSVRLFAEKDGSYIQLSQQTISGDSTDVIRSLCFQIDCIEKETAYGLFQFLKKIDWRIGVATISWQNSYFVQEQKMILQPESRSHFCYAGLRNDRDTSELLDSLSFSQKAELWKAFLQDSFEPVEFEWLKDAICQDSLNNRMEWELALRETMNQLGFQIINQNKNFQIYDGTGQRHFFGADMRHPAEWAFLKTLFPLND